MLRLLLCLAAAFLALPPAGAEVTRPGGSTFTLHGYASGTLAPVDHGFFNDTSYETNALRVARLALSGTWRPHARISLLGELRQDNASAPKPYALYLHATPRVGTPLFIQAGLVPPTFGGYTHEGYGRRSALLATPIAYQYLTTLRSDAAPATADDLLRVRGGGWRVRHRLGNPTPAPGLPLVDPTRADAGIRLVYSRASLDAALSLTQGSPSRPRIKDDNGGRQVALRVSGLVHPALRLGLSHARGEWLARDALRGRTGDALASPEQIAWSAFLESSGGPWLARVEAVFSGWAGLPSELSASPLRARGVTAELRRRLAPGLDLAVRGEHLGFSRLRGATRTDSWDAPVRHLVLKIGVQRNTREGGRLRASTLGAAQVLAWF